MKNLVCRIGGVRVCLCNVEANRDGHRPAIGSDVDGKRPRTHEHVGIKVARIG